MGVSDFTPSDSGPQARAADGKPNAEFWAYIDGFRPYLKCVAAKVLGRQLSGKVDASDIVQRGLLAAYENREQFRGNTEAEWQQWLVTIINREALDLLRLFQREKRNPNREQRLQIGSSGHFEINADDSTPSARAVRREDTARLLLSLARLPADYQAVLHLRTFEDLDHHEIAQKLGRSEGAIRQIWVRAVRRLKQELGECRDESKC